MIAGRIATWIRRSGKAWRPRRPSRREEFAKAGADDGIEREIRAHLGGEDASVFHGSR